MGDQHSEVAAQRLVQAILTLHQQATSSIERAAANAWLESFEQNAVAWQVSSPSALLHAVLYRRSYLACGVSVGRSSTPMINL